MLASSIGYGAGLGVLSMTSSLFVKPMRDELGWSTKVVAFLPLTMLLVAVCTPIVGALVDRFGSRRIALIGMMAFGFSIGALAFIPPSQFALYTVAVILGIVGPMTSTTPFARCVATWFDRSAGTAFGLTMNGVSFLALFVVPLISAVIYAYGWRMGYLTLSLVILLFGFPVLYFLLHERPSPRPANLANAAADKYSGMRQVFADGRFWAVLVAIGFAGIPLGGFLGHLQPMLAAGGMPIAAATSLGVVFAISVTLGRVGGGVLLDRYWDGGVALTLLLLSAVGAVLLSSFGVTTPFWLIAFAVLLVGMGQGIEADFIAYFALKMFGMRKYSTVVAIYSMTAGLMMASGGFAFSVLFDAIGDYAIACLIGAGSFLISGVILFVTRMADRHSIRSAAQAI
ncbi:MAG: MFS transporter [Sphingomonadaceae bacterium]